MIGIDEQHLVKRGLDYKWQVLVTVILAAFMVLLDTTVVNVAFQTLRVEFGATLADAQWIISIYVLALGISTPIAGFLADRFGIKRAFLGGLLLFIIGSLVCGLAPNLDLLIAARAFQGAGGAVAAILGTALLFNAFPRSEQGLALGIFGIVALVGPAVGPILGGWLVDLHLWRAIFFINPPIGLIAVRLATRLLSESKSQRPPSFDVLGLIAEVVGFGAVLYGASMASARGWTSPEVVTAFGIGGIGLVVFAFVELFIAKEPLLDLRLFRKHTFLGANVLGYVSVIALSGAEFLLPVYLQALRGRSALETGIILLPLALTGGIVTPLAGRLYDKVGPRPLMVVGFGILMINTWQLSLLTGDTPISWLLFLLALRGISLGLTLQTTIVTALSDVPLPEVARGTSLTNATRLVVQSIGVAVLATVLASTISPQIQALQNQFAQAQGTPTMPPVGLCEASSLQLAGRGASPALQGGIGLLREACRENIAGFGRAYTVTFYAAIVALFLGLLLPGWPFKWQGRQGPGKSPDAH